MVYTSWFAATAILAALFSSSRCILAPVLVTLLLALSFLPRWWHLRQSCEEEKRLLKVAEKHLNRHKERQEQLVEQLKAVERQLAKQEDAIAKEMAYQCQEATDLTLALRVASKAQQRAEAEELKQLSEVLLLCINWASDSTWTETMVTTSRTDYHTAFAEALAPGVGTLRRSRGTGPIIESEEVLQQCAGVQLEHVVSSALEGLQNTVAWWRS